MPTFSSTPSNRKRNVLDGELARLDFREVENVVDDAQQMLSGTLDLDEVIALPRRHLRFQGDLGQADNGIHRCADFVAHIGQKVGLEPGRLFGEFLRGLGLVVADM